MGFRKLLVIGIDGAPYPLISQWAASGDMPNMARLIERGSFGVLRSTIPVHSPTAWTTFITGLNPGQHGVFDFVRRETEGYALRVVRADQIPGRTLWGLMGDEGRRVGVMNVPMTYPPEPVNGFLVSGLGTPDFVPFAYPAEFGEALEREGYRVNKKFFFVADRQDEWLDDIFDMTAKGGATAVRLMREQPWDFFMTVFRNSDEICHFYWHHMDPSHPNHDPSAPARYQTAIRDLYALIDRWVGELVAAAGDDANVVVMSDHGAGPLYRDVFLNEWLLGQGYLTLRPEAAAPVGWHQAMRRVGLTRARISDTLTRLDMHRVEVLIKRALGDRIQVLPRDQRLEFTNAIDWERTRAYSFGYYGQVFINLKGREPEGIVEPADYEPLREAIATAMEGIVDPDDGLPVVDRVYRKEELFHGRYLDDAPDLLAIMRGLSYITRKGYEFAGRRGQLFRAPYTDETGSHRLEGIVAAAGPDIAVGALPETAIEDLTPTLLYLQGCSIPRYMDGRIISEAVASTLSQAHQPVYVDRPIDETQAAEGTWDEAAEADVTERLKQLGYLG